MSTLNPSMGSSCDECQTESTTLLQCSQCHLASYCGRACQKRAWRGGHKQICQSLRRRDELAEISPVEPATCAGEDCPLCLEEPIRPVKLPCGHHMCTACLADLRKHQFETCPLCRAQMPLGPDKAVFQALSKIAQVRRQEGGSLYERGDAISIPKSSHGIALQAEAVSLLENALKEDPENGAACGLLATLLLPNVGVEPDLERAMQLLRISADSGDATAQYNLGLILYRGKHGLVQDQTKGVQLWQASASAGYALAAINLGSAYIEGDGVLRDYKQAHKWLEFAAERGDVKALVNLGKLYLKGWGAARDRKRAFQLFRQAAKQGEPEAYDMLGKCYREGHGVVQDHNRGFELHQQAAELGCLNANVSIAGCYEKGTGVKQNVKKAFQMYKEIAAKGDIEATYNVGVCYDRGTGVTSSTESAMRFYLKAAARNHPSASFNMGCIYASGRAGGDEYATKAIECFLAAERSGHERAGETVRNFMDALGMTELHQAQALAELGC